MQEVVPGLHQWTAEHPQIRARVSSHFVAGSATAIDPLLPEEGGMEWLEGHPPQRIVLSNRHHLRHSERIAAAVGCPILCHESGLHEFEGGPEVEGFAFDDRLAEDVIALEMDAICPDDTVLAIEAGNGTLLFADSLIHYGGVGFVSDGLIGEGPEAVKAKIRERSRALLDQPCDTLLFAHGEPLIGGGRDALRAVAEGGA